MIRRLLAVLLVGAIAANARAESLGPTAALSIGHTFTIESKVLGEPRRINVFRPTIYGDTVETSLPVLYMPDGGIAEDFLHVAGLVQVLVSNGGMRPFLLVGIENTQRRRDMTGPTDDPEDRKIAPLVGGSAAFRQFVRSELMPAIASRYKTTRETAVIGESLAGLFVVETLFLEPDLFDSYLAFDPSLWWNRSALLTRNPPSPPTGAGPPKTLFVASSREKDMSRLARLLAERLRRVPGIRLTYLPMPGESHATIYHPAALAALRAVFAPVRPAR